MKTELTILGKHILLDLRGVDPAKANDEKFVHNCLVGAAEAGSAQILKVVTHSFLPHGVTGFALLAESHISLHSWPEQDYVAVDLFFCGGDIEKAVAWTIDSLKPKNYEIKRLERTVPDYK